MVAKLGQLKSLTLKSVWAHEEHEFTPWLVMDAHLSQLSAAIGMDLQFDRREVPVGPFFADILAKNESGEYVVIENQFGKTNHDHLGKLLTYGATLGASAVVWIAERFTDEHKKAIDWLNEKTTESFSLYAVQLEVLQVDDSLPAIRFNVICEPNEVVRAATAAKESGSLTETQQMQLEFWTLFRQRLLEKKVVSTAQKPQAQYWFHVPLGRASIYLSLIFDTNGSRVGVRVYIRGQVATPVLTRLDAQKTEIEKEIGEKLVWNPNPDKNDKTIGLYRNVEVNNKVAWNEYCDWLVERVERFRKAFMPRVKDIDLKIGGLDQD